MRLPEGPRRASHLTRQERGIWQRRFWEHHIRDEADLASHVWYCHHNPVKHGLVARPEDWALSSVHHR
jgi:putative transposase